MEKEHIGMIICQAVLNVTQESNPTLEKLPVVILENFKYCCNAVMLPIILFINGVKVADCCKGLGIRPNSCEK